MPCGWAGESGQQVFDNPFGELAGALILFWPPTSTVMPGLMAERSGWFAWMRALCYGTDICFKCTKNDTDKLPLVICQ